MPRQVLAEKAEMEEEGGVKVDSFADASEPEHMRITMDPRTAWVKPPPSNGNLKGAGVNTGEEHHDFGDVHVTRGEVSPVHVPDHHPLAVCRIAGAGCHQGSSRGCGSSSKVRD